MVSRLRSGSLNIVSGSIFRIGRSFYAADKISIREALPGELRRTARDGMRPDGHFATLFLTLLLGRAGGNQFIGKVR
jgi:hypothetical protein